jgi:hypothetical protein
VQLYGDFSLTGSGDPERLRGWMVSASVFSILRVVPMLGRTFDPEEDRKPVAMISESLWRRRFGADRGILGRAVTLNAADYIVIGVLPAGFQFPLHYGPSADDVAIPIGQATGNPMMQDRQFHPGIRVVGRLKTGVESVARPPFPKQSRPWSECSRRCCSDCWARLPGSRWCSRRWESTE